MTETILEICYPYVCQWSEIRLDILDLPKHAPCLALVGKLKVGQCDGWSSGIHRSLATSAGFSNSKISCSRYHVTLQVTAVSVSSGVDKSFTGMVLALDISSTLFLEQCFISNTIVRHSGTLKFLIAWRMKSLDHTNSRLYISRSLTDCGKQTHKALRPSVPGQVCSRYLIL